MLDIIIFLFILMLIIVYVLVPFLMYITDAIGSLKQAHKIEIRNQKILTYRTRVISERFHKEKLKDPTVSEEEFLENLTSNDYREIERESVWLASCEVFGRDKAGSMPYHLQEEKERLKQERRINAQKEKEEILKENYRDTLSGEREKEKVIKENYKKAVAIEEVVVFKPTRKLYSIAALTPVVVTLIAFIYQLI